jgi:class 3 adenylate cyclase/pimeloyl-ACP methyl ester carboxylesterase
MQVGQMDRSAVRSRLAAILVADVVAYSRLMERDQAGTIDRLKAFRQDVFERAVTDHDGRVFKVTGDGALVEFSSAPAAVRSAIQIQRAASDWNEQIADADPIELRIGISLGEVFSEQGDLMGNAVNVAARLEALAEPGGICISGAVQEHLKHGHEFSLRDLGTCNVKNIAAPVRLYQVNIEPTEPGPTPSFSPERQPISFCRAPDGVQLAYTTYGAGSPVVLVSNWLTHLELDWKIAFRRRIIEDLSKNHMVVRYDARGNGLSDWDVDDMSFEASVADLDTVIDTLGLKEFALLGSSQGAAIAAAYAARHPDAVTRLFLYGGYARGRRKRGSEGAIAESDAFVTMIREGWGKEIDAYVRMFGAFFMPDADSRVLEGFTSLQRNATPPENAARIQLAIDNIDITQELSRIAAPTLVLHVRGDARAPFDEGRRMAAAIPNARFVPLEGRNHALLDGEPAQTRFLKELEDFMRD